MSDQGFLTRMGIWGLLDQCWQAEWSRAAGLGTALPGKVGDLCPSQSWHWSGGRLGRPSRLAFFSTRLTGGLAVPGDRLDPWTGNANKIEMSGLCYATSSGVDHACGQEGAAPTDRGGYL